MKIDDVNRIGVVGAGQMGRGITLVVATSGWEVSLYDLNEAVLEAAMQKIREGLTRGVEKGTLKADQVKEALARVRPTSRLADVAETQLIIEAAPESLDLKCDLFRQ